MCEPIVVSCNKKKPHSSDCLVYSYRNHCMNCRGLSKPSTCKKCLFYGTGLCDGIRLKEQQKDQIR